MLDKYVRVGDREIVSGQDGKTGLWYCKELVTKTTKETKDKIGELNKIYNDYNKQIKNGKDNGKEDKKKKTTDKVTP